MRRVLLALALVALFRVPTFAQDHEADLRAKFPYATMAAKYPGLTMDDYNVAIRILAKMPDLVAEVAQMPIRPLTAAPSTSQSTAAAIALNNPPPPRPAIPPVPRITYPTTRGTYEWEASHLRSARR